MGIKVKLPRYVVAVTRPNGAVDFHYTIPARLRPKDWPKNIRLPKDRSKRARNASATELAAVEADAKLLNAKLDAIRAGKAAQGYQDHGTLEWLMERWRKSEEWSSLKPKTRSFYDGGWTHIKKWSDHNRRPHISRIAWPVIYKLVKGYGATPGVQRQVINVLQRLCQIAHDEGIIAENPWDGQKRRRWQSKKATEARSSKRVIGYAQMLEIVAICDMRGQPSMGTAVMIGFEIMQYPEDIRQMRYGSHYSTDAGVFRFDRTKTGVPAEVPASAALRARLAKPKGLWLCTYEATGKAYDRRHFNRVFRKCTEGTPYADFEFRWLRHSGVKECDDAGLDPRMIDAIGAWKPGGSGEAVRNANYRQHNADLAAAGMSARERFRGQ